MVKQRVTRWIGLLCVVLAVGSLVGVALSFRSVHDYDGATRTTATVINIRAEVRSVKSSNGIRHNVTFIRPLLHWRDAAGADHEFWSEVSSSPGPKVGDTIPVEYLPGKPASARQAFLAGSWLPAAWLPVLITALMLVLFTVFAVVFLVVVPPRLT